jgi:thioredoxin-related protein
MNKVTLLFLVPVMMFAGELKDTLLKAKREHKPIMVYVKAESCQFCDKMKKNTLSDPTVQNNISDFLFVVADKNSLDAKKYLPSTRYTPTVYFISSKFKVVNTVKGYLGKDDFNLWVDDSKAKLGMTGHSQNAEAVVSTTQSDIWMYDMESAKDYATQTGKQIMVYIDKSNSKWSRKMRQNTFTSDSVKEALSNFVWVKIQKDSAEAKNYNFTPKYAPSVYFLRADGRTLAVAEGYFGDKDFLKWVRYAKSKI